MSGTVKVNQIPPIVSQHSYDRYMRLMHFWKCQEISGYSERHHIVPKSFGGGNGTDNIIRLYARQHFVAHRLLWAAFRGSKMGRAFYSMCNIRGCVTTKKSKEYAIARVSVAESTAKIGAQSKGKELTAAHKSAISAGLRGNPVHRLAVAKSGEKRRGTTASEETRAKMSAFQKGKFVSAETRQKISDGKTGTKYTAEHRARISAGNMGKVHYQMTDEIRKKISDGLKGKTLSQETREKLREKTKLQWATKREEMIASRYKGGMKCQAS